MAAGSVIPHDALQETGRGPRARVVRHSADYDAAIVSRRGAGANVAERYVLRLYVADATTRSTRAIDATRGICRTHLTGRYRLKVIDIYREPKLARRDQILAVPTLVKTAPAPARTVVGDLYDGARVLAALQIPAAGSAGS